MNGELAFTILGAAVQVGGFIILWSFRAGQKERDFVSRADLDVFRRDVEMNYARRSETRQEIAAVTKLMEQRIDNLEVRMDDLKMEMRDGVKQIIAKIVSNA